MWVSEWSEMKWSEVKWSKVKWSEVKWSGSEWVGEWGREGGREWGKVRLKTKNVIHLCLYLSIHRRYVCLSPYLPIYLSIDLSIYLSNLPGRREHATCRSKMPATTWQGDEWRKPCISNMPSRRQKRPPEGQKRPPEGQKCQQKHDRET